jgi:3-hydroxybutyryl-CoA dehydrogenase
MNVLLLADDLQKEELLNSMVNNAIQITSAKTPEDLKSGELFDTCIDLLFENTQKRIDSLKKINAPLTIINSVITPVKDIQQNFIRINGWNTFLNRSVMEASHNNTSLQKKTEQLFLTLGKKTEWVPDIPGFITARVVASIVNEAFFALEEKISTRGEIDVAMKLGTNYPYGPFEWSNKIGLLPIYSLLSVLSREQTRYQPCSLLKQAALA